jgi:predicted Ser/Thr protein kinase
MDPLQPGDPVMVGSYRLLGRLGAGGMGQVFLGVSPGGRKVAVKVIYPFHARTPSYRERFAREVQAAQRVGGFHTAPVVDADPHADPPWMVTAFIEGPSLQDAVDRDGPLPPDEVRTLGAGLAEGLAAIHARGLVHRDLKPGNVILAPDGPRIIDFGIARVIDATPGITTAGAVIGTFAYMSPEHLGGEATGPASDVFSLGSVLAFAATGRPPFSGATAAAVMFRLFSQAPDLAALADHELAGLIGGCLDKSPEDRPTVSHLLAALGGPGPAPLLTGAPGNAAGAAADGVPMTDGPTQTGTGPVREARPWPATGLAADPTAPPRPARAGQTQPSRRRPRRWPAALIASAALAAGLAIALPILFTGHPSQAAARHRADTATSAEATITHRRPSPSPVASVHRRTRQHTARGTSPVTHPSTSSPARTQLVDVPDTIGLAENTAIRELEAAGFQVQVDNFGTGSSNVKVIDYSPVGAAPYASTVIIDVGPAGGFPF